MCFQIEIRNGSRQDRARARELVNTCKHSDYIRSQLRPNMILKNAEGTEI